jgi:hypothetical protein
LWGFCDKLADFVVFLPQVREGEGGRLAELGENSNKFNDIIYKKVLWPAPAQGLQ